MLTVPKALVFATEIVSQKEPRGGFYSFFPHAEVGFEEFQTSTQTSPELITILGSYHLHTLLLVMRSSALLLTKGDLFFY